MSHPNVPAHTVVESITTDNGSYPAEAQHRTGAEDKDAFSLKDEPLYVQAAFEFLGRKGVTLWADFLITDHHGRLRAARWLAKEMVGVQKVIGEMGSQDV